MRQSLNPQQVQRVIASLRAWLWVAFADMLKGRNIKVYPTSESGDHIGGVMRCVADSAGRPAYLISLGGGISDVSGQVPKSLLAAVNTAAYLPLKTSMQFTLALSPFNQDLGQALRDQYIAALDTLAPNWRSLQMQGKNQPYNKDIHSTPVPTTALLEIDMRIAVDKVKGEPIFVDKTVDGVATQSLLYQCNGIKVLSLTTSFEDGGTARKVVIVPDAEGDATKSFLKRAFGATIAPEEHKQTEEGPKAINRNAITEPATAADVLKAAKAAGQNVTMKVVKSAIEGGTTADELLAIIEGGELVADYAPAS